MFDNLTRNLVGFKNKLEIALHKCIFDDVPKLKHIQTIQYYLQGQSKNITSENTHQKLQKMLLQNNNPKIQLKLLFIGHILKIQYKLVESPLKQQNLEDQVLGHIVKVYYEYLINKKEGMEKIQLISRMKRVLEVVLLKLDIPIIKEITKLLISDIITLYQLYKSSQTRNSQNIQFTRCQQHVQGFLELRKYIQLSLEQEQQIAELDFIYNEKNAFPIPRKPLVDNFVHKIKTEFIRDLGQDHPDIIGDIKDSKYLQIPMTPNNNSIENRRRASSFQRKNNYTINTSFRGNSIRDGFYDHRKSPLSFIIH